MRPHCWTLLSDDKSFGDRSVLTWFKCYRCGCSVVTIDGHDVPECERKAPPSDQKIIGDSLNQDGDVFRDCDVVVVERIMRS